MKHLIAVIIACILPLVAFALPSPNDVDQAFNSGNYLKAESMLNEVMKVHPSAKAHFRLGEVYMRENRHKEALNEFRQAQVLDPSLGFVKSAEIFNRLVTTEQAIVTGAGSVVVATPETQVAVIQAKSEAHQQEVSHTFGWIGIFLLVAFGLLILFYVIGNIVENRRKKAEEEEAAQKKAKVAREQLATFVDLNSQLEDASLIVKTSTANADTKTRIQSRITSLESTLVDLMADAKKGNIIGDSRLYTIKANVKEIVEAANTGVYEQPVRRNMTAAPTPTPTPTPGYTSTPRTPAPVVHKHYYTPAPTPAPTPAAPTVIVQSNNNDLLTGVLIGEELSASRRERVEEVYVPAPAPYVNRRNDDDTFTSSRKSSSWDDDTSSSARSTSSWDDDSRSSASSSSSWNDSSSSSSSSSSWNDSSSSSSSSDSSSSSSSDW